MDTPFKYQSKKEICKPFYKKLLKFLTILVCRVIALRNAKILAFRKSIITYNVEDEV